MHVQRTLSQFLLAGAVCSARLAAGPDHPILTEVYCDPRGFDGPTGRDPSNLHQEFIEIYLPTAGELATKLNKNALRLTVLEIEGDADNVQQGHVTQRIDLPPFDVDPANGIAAGSVARPPTGIVVIGWLDYDALNPPNALAGTTSTRIALINGGITTHPSGVTFIGINGNQFGGTSNFVRPTSESFIDMPDENRSGILRNGSNVYLLVNRDDPGYSMLQDRQHPELGPSNASLPTGTVLHLSALLDGFAANDDPLFTADQQPRIPAGLDLDAVLPEGGVFSRFVPQIAEESGGGYARRYVDGLKSTENEAVGDEDPALDAHDAYRLIYRDGPFFPTPGAVVLSTDPPALAAAEAARLVFNVLAGTTGRPGLLCANVGGNFAIEIAAAPGVSSNAAVAVFSSSFAASGVVGQQFGYPQIAVDVPLEAPAGAIATASVNFEAVNTLPGDPPLTVSSASSAVQCTVLNPAFGMDELGLPYQATVLAAMEGVGSEPKVTNELAGSDLGQYAKANLGTLVLASLGHADHLLGDEMDLENAAHAGALTATFPADETTFINASAPPGLLDLAGTVALSPKNILAPAAYGGSINFAGTAVRAIEVQIPETLTSAGLFSPSDFVFFADAIGSPFDRRDGLGWATTTRTFELAIIDSNSIASGLETGTSDDFGLVVQVGRTRTGANVQTGEFVFLSYMGGLGGEDIDGVDVPGDNPAVAILLDLDHLDSLLGCETITHLFIVDAAGANVLEPMEVLSLNPLCASEGGCPFYGDGDRDGEVGSADTPILVGCLAGPGQPIGPNPCSVFNSDNDGDVDLQDYALLLQYR